MIEVPEFNCTACQDTDAELTLRLVTLPGVDRSRSRSGRVLAGHSRNYGLGLHQPTWLVYSPGVRYHCVHERHNYWLRWLLPVNRRLADSAGFLAMQSRGQQQPKIYVAPRTVFAASFEPIASFQEAGQGRTLQLSVVLNDRYYLSRDPGVIS